MENHKFSLTPCGGAAGARAGANALAGARVGAAEIKLVNRMSARLEKYDDREK